MRILYWTELFWPYIGGVELHGVKLLKTMQERGYETIVVTSHGSLDLPDEAEYKGIPIYRFHFLNSLKFGRTLRSADWVTCVPAAILADTQALVPEVIPRSSVIHIGLEAPSISVY